MKKRYFSIASWLIVIWITKVFLFSLPYKFTNHPDTQHIFGTIGAWMQTTINQGLGTWFIHYGAYAVGTAELITSLVLLSPALFWLLHKTGINKSFPPRHLMHAIGGLMASTIMTGAVFFHLFTPLGIEVLNEGKNDHGSLFFAAVSILISGVVLFFINRMVIKDSQAAAYRNQIAWIGQ